MHVALELRFAAPGGIRRRRGPRAGIGLLEMRDQPGLEVLSG